MDNIDFDKIKKPKGHEKYSNDDIDKCPIMASQIKKDKQSLQIKEQKQDIEKNPKKEKKPKGGCPFMPSDKKKNPMLGPMEMSYDVVFISPYQYFFDYCPLLQLSMMEKPPKKISEKKIYEQYPIYLKHSLMIDDDENMNKVREMEVSKRFFCYDKFREKGNKEYYKGNYDVALSFYERAFHCFRWLSYVPPKEEEENSDEEIEINEQQNQNINQEEENLVEEQKQEDDQEQVIKDNDKNIDLNANQDLSEKEQKEVDDYITKMKQQKKEFKERYKNLMKTYNDDTVVLRDGEDLTDSQEIDMRNSMLHTILMLLGVCYMKLNHYKLAAQAIDDSMKVYDKSTQLNYRRSQTISFNKWSTLDELELAKKDIENAIEMKKYEKIFQESQPGILKIMNLHNHEEAYKEQAVHCVQRIYERKEWELERVKFVFGREKRLQEIHQQMIEDGKTPKSLDDDSYEINQDEFDKKIEMMIIHEMVKKYYKAIEFYTEQKDQNQLDAARYQLQKLLETVQEMVYYFELDWTCWAAQEGNKSFNFDLSNEKLLKRLDRIKKQKAKDIFDNCQSFNFEIFKWALDDVMKAKKKYNEQKEQQNKENDNKKQVQTLYSTLTKPSFIAQVGVFISFILLISIILKNQDQLGFIFNSLFSNTPLDSVKQNFFNNKQ